MDKVVDLYLNLPQTRQKWQAFLQQQGLANFSQREIAVIDHTIGLIDENGQLVGTGSVAGNVLKYIAVCNQGVTPGARFNQVVTTLQQYLYSQQIFHSFVFTKAQYSGSFSHLGFQGLARTDEAAFLESGTPDIASFLAAIPRVQNQDQKRIAAIVMNANPFTCGHRQLVKQASRENDFVYVFVVATDLSLFNTAERTQLVMAGTADFENVQVVSGGDYLVSQSTFPAYFLKSPMDLIATQTAIDALVFKNWVAPALNIRSRYLGSEPFSRTTSVYNQSLQALLAPEIAVKIVPRFTTHGQVITATRVRQLLKDDNLNAISKFVPVTTLALIKQQKTILQTRIKKGINIDGN